VRKPSPQGRGLDRSQNLLVIAPTSLKSEPRDIPE
jgi:hypothetical protein